MGLETLLRNFTKINEQLTDSGYLKDILKRLDAQILDTVTDTQMFEQGINSKGKSLGDYSPYTIDIKKSKGQPYAHITLRDTGDFQRSFYIEFRDNEFEIMASDSKAAELQADFGKEIMGLTDANLDELIDIDIKEMLIQIIKKTIYETK